MFALNHFAYFDLVMPGWRDQLNFSIAALVFPRHISFVFINCGHLVPVATLCGVNTDRLLKGFQLLVKSLLECFPVGQILCNITSINFTLSILYRTCGHIYILTHKIWKMNTLYILLLVKNVKFFFLTLVWSSGDIWCPTNLHLTQVRWDWKWCGMYGKLGQLSLT